MSKYELDGHVKSLYLWMALNSYLRQSGQMKLNDLTVKNVVLELTCELLANLNIQVLMTFLLYQLAYL